MGGMTRKGPVDLSGMNRRFFEALSPEAQVKPLCRLHALAIEQVEGIWSDSPVGWCDDLTEQQDGEHGIDQQDVLYRMVLFLATETVRLFSRVQGADNAPFRSVMSKRGVCCPALEAETGEGIGSCSGATTSGPSETANRCARAVRERAGASPRPRSTASNAGSRTWIHWLALLWLMPNSRPWTT
jgi:hypothetical protein